PRLCASSFLLPSTPTPHPLSLHDALPISQRPYCSRSGGGIQQGSTSGRAFQPARVQPRLHSGRAQTELEIGQTGKVARAGWKARDRKSTRLNSSHRTISYAVFCLKKKKEK